MRNKTIRKVAVVLSLEHASSRDTLPGISEYVRGRCRWYITVFTQPASMNLKDLEHQFDGMILDERTAIQRARLAEVAKRLRANEAPISHIASQCAFDNLQHLANAFKRRYVMTMTAYRQSSKTPTPPPQG